MCFYSKASKSATELEHRFNAKFESIESYIPGIYNGFSFPKTPVITNKAPEIIRLFTWGLIPLWAKDDSIKKYTLNAKIETINEKPSFRESKNKHCLILADGFFEWQWLDEKGKQKQKYLLTLPNDEPFAFAGLWSEWKNPLNNEIIFTYTILTTVANKLLSEIHNTKKRMPLILSKDGEKLWLSGNELKIQNNELIARKE